MYLQVFDLCENMDREYREFRKGAENIHFKDEDFNLESPGVSMPIVLVVIFTR